MLGFRKSRTLSLPILASVIVAVSLVGVADAHAEKLFSNADLHGSYGFSFEGTIVGSPLVAVGVFNADGAGNFTSAVRTLVAPGVGGVIEQTATGSYEINANGTGTAEFDVCTLCVGEVCTDSCPPGPTASETFTFVLTDHGKEALLVSTTAGVVARGVAKRQ